MLVFEATAEFQLVSATNPTQRSTVIVDILKAITRSGDGIAYRRITIDLDKRRPNGNVKTGLVSKAESGWRGVVRAFSEKEFVAQEGKAQNANHGWSESMRFLGNEILCPMILAYREARYARSRGGERIKTCVITDHVAKVQGIVDRQIMVYSESAFVRVITLGLRGIKCVESAVRQRKKAQEVLSERVQEGRWQLIERERGWRIRDQKCELVGRITAEASAVERFTLRSVAQLGKISASFFHGRHCGACGFTLAVAKALVKCKEKRLVFSNRAPDGGAELILLQWFGRLCKVILRIECVVAQELPQRSMDSVGP